MIRTYKCFDLLYKCSDLQPHLRYTSSKISDPTSKLHITCTVWLDQTTEIESTLEQGPVQEFIDEAEAAFKFVMTIPDPSETKNQSGSLRSSVSYGMPSVAALSSL